MEVGDPLSRARRAGLWRTTQELLEVGKSLGAATCQLERTAAVHDTEVAKAVEVDAHVVGCLSSVNTPAELQRIRNRASPGSGCMRHADPWLVLDFAHTAELHLACCSVVAVEGALPLVAAGFHSAAAVKRCVPP